MRRVWCLFLLVGSVRCMLHRYPHIDGDLIGGDAGEPLFLTPYIESGKIDEARRLARVPFTETLGFKSYSGFFTVDKQYESNHFLWYFPAMSNTPNAPIILWLQGGPGATSLFGLFTENGPLQVINGSFAKRKYNWALNHHLIYIDNPVGTGFSFTKFDKGYCTDESQVGRQLYTTLVQFFKLFPELQTNKFFVTGESYGGKYVPALAYTIHKNNPSATLKINLSGVAIGNGLSDPEHQLLYSKYLYQLGLIDNNQKDVFAKEESRAVDFIRNKKFKEAFEIFDSLLNGDLIKPHKSVFYNMTGFDFYFNFLHTNDYTDNGFGTMLQKPTVRRSIHVGDLPFNDGSIVERHLMNDIMQSVAPYITELLDHYYVVIYSGQLDIIVAYPLTLNYLQNLKFTGANEYKTAKRYVWKVDNEVAGYVKQAGRLVEIMVRNAGHMVPLDQPKWALDLITRFTHEKTYLSNNDRT